MTFVEHDWNMILEDQLGEREKLECPHCHMVKETIEGEVTYKLPGNTPSRWKPATIPPGEDWSEPSCKSSLRALGVRLLNKSKETELLDADTCCVSWEQGGATIWECGGFGICDCNCHHVMIEAAI